MLSQNMCISRESLRYAPLIFPAIVFLGPITIPFILVALMLFTAHSFKRVVMRLDPVPRSVILVITVYCVVKVDPLRRIMDVMEALLIQLPMTFETMFKVLCVLTAVLHRVLSILWLPVSYSSFYTGLDENFLLAVLSLLCLSLLYGNDQDNKTT